MEAARTNARFLLAELRRDDGRLLRSWQDGRANLLPFDHVIDTAYDPYALVRNLWFQKRDYKVHGDAGPDDKDRASLPPSVTCSHPLSEPTTSTVRDFVGSRRMYPRCSSVFRWFCTVELELRPMATPISRTVGG